MPHVDLKVKYGRRPLTEREVRAWCAVLCAELNSVRKALDLPLRTLQEVEAAVRAARQQDAGQKADT
ncbi:MAG TPA: hypothetical protein VF077_12500 [Nitrospiraceae bacterium]